MRHSAVCLVFGVSVLMPATGWAQKPTVEQQRVACTPDAFRLCSHEIPSIDRIVQCLRVNKPNLSVQCRQMFDATEARPRASTRSMSRDDGIVRAWCPGTSAGQPAPDVWSAWCEEAAVKR